MCVSLYTCTHVYAEKVDIIIINNNNNYNSECLYVCVRMNRACGIA